MKIIKDYYLIEPGDSLDEIKYLINIGCKVLGYFKIGKLLFPMLFNLKYSRFGAEIDKIAFCEYNKNNFDAQYYYLKW